MELSFGEQIKEILDRKNMTVGMLAQTLTQQTGQTVAPRDLAKRLYDDMCTGQEMRDIAQALGCVYFVSVIDPMEATVASIKSMIPEAFKESGVELPEEFMGEDDEADVAIPVNTAWAENASAKWEQQMDLLDEGFSLGLEEPEEDSEDLFALNLDDDAIWGNLDESDEDEILLDPDDLIDENFEIRIKEKTPEERIMEGELDIDDFEDITALLSKSAEEILNGSFGKPAEEPIPETFPELLPSEHEMVDLDDISGVSGPYVLKREEAPAPETLYAPAPTRAYDGEEEIEDETLEPGVHPLHMNEDGALVSEPYIIERTEEPAAYQETTYGGYAKLTKEELEAFHGANDYSDPDIVSQGAATNVNARVSVVSEIREEKVGETLAAWDAVMQKKIGRTIADDAQEMREQELLRAQEEAELERLKQEETRRIAMINPATGEEFESNSVLHHPTKMDTLLVYDRETHSWAEQNERIFQNFQAEKRAEMGADYLPPIYLD